MIAALRANIAATLFGVIAAAALLIAVVQTVKLNGFLFWDGVVDKLQWCRDARKTDLDLYTQAQEKAAEQNKAQVAKIVTEQEKVSAKARSDYARDLAKLRGMRPKAKADQGAASGPPASPDGKAAGGADGDGVQVPPDDYLSAQEIELRLMHLQNWVRDQLAVPR